MSKSLEKQLLMMNLEFSEELKQIIRPKDQSDRTTFRRVAAFLEQGIKDKKYTIRIYKIVLNYAREAAGPMSRNPAAVFMKIIKEELNYGTS